MTSTTTRAEPVDVAAMMRQADTDVFQEARDRFAARLRAYRQGVARMAEHDGKLPADEAEQLLTVTRDLGIPPDRLSADVITLIRVSRLAAAVDAVMTQAGEQARVVAGLKAEVDVETAAFTKVKSECDHRVRTAQARLTELQRRHAAAAAVRHERTDDKQADMTRLRNQAPHLFRDDIDADTLRRIVASPAGR